MNRRWEPLSQDDALSQLQNAAEQWNKKLRRETPKNKIDVSVAVVGISTEFHISDKKFGKSTGNNLLALMHKVIVGV